MHRPTRAQRCACAFGPAPLPDLHHAIGSAGCDAFAVGRERSRAQRAAVAQHIQRLASLLEESQKRLNLPDVVLAGHVHNYERYVHGGVIYITAGGGGATPHEIPRDPADLYQAPGSTYSYCRVTVDRNSLSFQMIKVQIANQQPSFTVEDSFQLGQGHAKPAAASPKAKSSRARSPMHSWPSSRELYARPFSNQTQVALSQKAICDRLQLSEIPRNYLTQSAGG